MDTTKRLSLHFSSAAAAAKSLQSCLTLCDPIDGSPPGSPHLWDSPGKNTGVDCHFLPQCMKVKSESEVAHSCLTLSNPMDRSLPGSYVHGIFQARVLERGPIAFSITSLLVNHKPSTLMCSQSTSSQASRSSPPTPFQSNTSGSSGT